MDILRLERRNKLADAILANMVLTEKNWGNITDLEQNDKWMKGVCEQAYKLAELHIKLGEV